MKITSIVALAVSLSLLFASPFVYSEQKEAAKKVEKVAKYVSKDKQGKDKDKEEDKWDVNNPPGEEQTIQIKTNTSTWSNVDVSPDGQTVIFDMLGDIYSIPMKGGKATPIIKEMAWNMMPRFSPNGKQIAFISDRDGGDNLWTMDSRSEERRVGKEC